MAVEGQMLPLSEEEIDNLGDVMSAIRLARHHGIEDAVAVVARLIEADVTRRISLEGFYDTAATLMETLDTNIEHHLARDEFTMYYRDKLETKKAQLAAADCPILVAGETSAGKSSLLNLLLGQDLLPCSHLSSTSVICRLRYGVRRRAVAMTLDGVEKEIPLEENSDLNVLSEYVHNKQRDQPLPYKSVDIYLPINYLKSGVFLVDSPGIGESPAMTSVAMDYLSEAFAFIYVINSASAGGVQEDRLQALLQAVNSRKGEDDRPLFSPRSAIFVCNKWDLIPPSEREAVKQDTIRKLKASWPGFTTDQLFFLSTKIAADISAAGYIASDFVRLLDGIEKLLPISLRSKLQHQFRWLDYLVARVVYHSGVYVQQAKSSKATNTKLYRETEVRLNKLEKQAEHIIGKLQEFLQDRVEEGVGHLQSVLQSAHVQRMMSQWDETDLPDGEDWAALEKALETRISERLAAILSQEHFDSYLMDLESTITDEFRKEFSVIEQQLSWVEHALQGSRQDDLFDLLHDEEYTTKVHSIFNLSTGCISPMKSVTKGCISTMKSATEHCISTMKSATERCISTMESATKGPICTMKSVTEGCISTMKSATEGCISTMKSATEGCISTMKSATEGCISTMKCATEGCISTMESATKGPICTMKSATEGCIRTMESATEGCIRTMESATEGCINTMESATKGPICTMKSATEGCIRTMESCISTMKSATEGCISTMKSATERCISTMESTTKGPICTMKSATEGCISTMESATKGPICTMKSATEGCISTMKSATKGPICTMKSATEGCTSTMKSATEGCISTMESATKGPICTMKSATEGCISTMKSATEGCISTMKSATEGCISTMKSATEGCISTMKSATECCISTMKSATEGYISTMKSATEGCISTMKSATEGCQKFAIGLMSPIWLPVGIAVSAVVAIPVLAYLDIKAVRKKLASEKHLAVYRADKVQYMQQRVSTAMQRFSEKENMCQYVQAKLRNTADFLVKLEKIIPALIEADRSLVSSLQKEERSNEQLMLTYRPIYKTFMNLQGLLSAFEYQHVRDYDISESNITQSGVEVSDGLFSMLYSVNIQRESTTEVLSCKEYRARLDADSAATIKKEEEFLRRVDHKNIAALQGVGESVRQGVRHPVLLLEQLKGSLRTELQHPFRIPALMKSLYAIPEAKAKVIQILEGLLYLHCRGLVHAELSLDTVMVSMEGEVKLTNIGLPRYVAATNDTEDAMLPSAVYLHPDVLQKGGHYESYCDMYGLGLMMWEIWYGRRVYDGESLAHLLPTLGTRRPGDSIGEPPNSHWRNIMEACWAVLPTDRMEASQCLRQMRASSQCHSP
ncbi:MAP kinase kinase kinase [Branchiostoma belcheri]|nr:MAP kinase kinase kinase [Branchiostoma belcheri]